MLRLKSKTKLVCYELNVPERVAFKLGLMVFNCLHNQAPQYIVDLTQSVCIQCRIQTTPSLCQQRSSRRASLSSQQLRSAGFFCGRPCYMELVTRQCERPGHQQNSFRRSLKTFFIFSLLVYIAHQSFLDDALYKFTYLLTYLLSQDSVETLFR